jgi:hypothetical protein
VNGNHEEKKVLKLIETLEVNTAEKISDIKKTTDNNILHAVENVRLDIEKKIDHKINNLKMDIVGLQNQHEHLDSSLKDLKDDIRGGIKDINRLSGTMQGMVEAQNHNNGTIKWILTVGGTLFLSLLSFVLFKGL